MTVFFKKQCPWNHGLVCHCILLSLVLVVLIGFSSSSRADEIYFKSGYSHTAVIIHETKDSVTFKTNMGLSTVGRDQIDFIEKATPEENQKIQKKWREEQEKLEEARKARREAEQKFEREQIAKGLIKFEGAWMTPEAKAEILDLRNQAREDRRKFEAAQKKKGLVPYQYLWVTPENAQELRTMEPKIYTLYDQITAWKKRIESLQSGITSVGTMEEADKYSKRIEEINNKIADATKELGDLLKRSDEIEAVSVRYVMPERFRKAFETNPEAQ